MGGQYSEKLKTGGEIVVTTTEWKISYYFSGPDFRYNGTFIILDGKDINKYIDAWADNFKKYQNLKKSMPKEGNSEFPGTMQMSIRIGGFAEGVCIRSYHMPIRTQDKIIEVISDYKYARDRAVKIMDMLKGI